MHVPMTNIYQTRLIKRIVSDNLLNKLCALFFSVVICISQSHAANVVMYTLRKNSPDRMSAYSATLASLEKNYKKITILIPQDFIIKENGKVSDSIEPEIFNFAKKHSSIKLMPLVTNTEFSKSLAHQFLSDPSAQVAASRTILENCKRNHFYGIQIDFEMIDQVDREKLTAFYQSITKLFHANGLKVSIAVAPVVSNHPASAFQKRIYENWEMAYDFKQIGQIADFVSIMTYNQHAGITTPGPTASWEWTNQAVRYALENIPADKISIGVPAYSTYWYTGTSRKLPPKFSIHTRALNFEQADHYLHDMHANLVWDKRAKLHYAIFSRDWLNEYIFLEDRQSFLAKYDLVKKYHLHGISFFDLGTEDSSIWKVIK